MQQPEQPIIISDDALKLLVAQHGVRGTARVLQLDTRATNAFRKRVERAGWCQDPIIGPLAAHAVKDATCKPVVANLSPAQAYNEEMKRLSGETRLSVARTVHKGFAHAAEMKPQSIVVNAQDLKALGALGDTAHQWSNSAPTMKIALNITGNTAPEPQALNHSTTGNTIEAEWVDV